MALLCLDLRICPVQHERDHQPWVWAAGKWGPCGGPRPCAGAGPAGDCHRQLLTGLEEWRGAATGTAPNRWLSPVPSRPGETVPAAAMPELPSRQVRRAEQDRQRSGGLLCPGQSLLRAGVLRGSGSRDRPRSTSLRAGLPVGPGAVGRAGAGLSHALPCLAGESGEHAGHPEHLPRHGHGGGRGGGVE